MMHSFSFTNWLRRAHRLAFQSSPSLVWTGWLSLLTAAVALGLSAVDPRQLSGASVWLKPMKFGMSIAIASFTLAWLLRAIVVPARARRRLVAIFAWLTGLELVIISGQAARGVPSHFNAKTLLDLLLFQIMGAAITIVTIAVARLGVYAFRTRYANPALGAGIRLGISVMVFGSVIAFFMPRPTPAQLESLRAGQKTELIGSHTVGLEGDARRALPLTRWNTQAGDLRVPHFVGLHGLQVLPLTGLWLSRRKRLTSAAATKLTYIAGAGYFGLTLMLLVQALRGVPPIAFDAVTLASLATFALGCTAATITLLLTAARRVEATA